MKVYEFETIAEFDEFNTSRESACCQQADPKAAVTVAFEDLITSLNNLVDATLGEYADGRDAAQLMYLHPAYLPLIQSLVTYEATYEATYPELAAEQMPSARWLAQIAEKLLRTA